MTMERIPSSCECENLLFSVCVVGPHQTYDKKWIRKEDEEYYSPFYTRHTVWVMLHGEFTKASLFIRLRKDDPQCPPLYV